MKTSIKEEILSNIRKQKYGWAFSAIDFIKNFKRREIDESLSTLTHDGDIRRVTRGLYDLPMYSSILSRHIAPDINQVANAFARKFNWTIYPDGDTALNYLGLSTQMVAKHLYLSNGPSKKYIINDITLEFKHVVLKEIALKNNNAVLVVQAIRVLGEQHVTQDFLEQLASKFSLREWGDISENSASVAIWIYEIIKTAHDIAQRKTNG